MMKAALIRSLPDLPGPLLTVYLDTDQAKPANRELERKEYAQASERQGERQGLNAEFRGQLAARS